MTLVEKFIRVGDGSPILWKSVWLTSVDYAVDDTVINDGSGYICILAHTSGAASEPGTGGSYATYWEVFPGAGPAGVKGDTGDQGEQGLPGRDGTVIRMVQFCPGVTVYPSKFIEVGMCVDGVLYATYSANGGFTSKIPAGSYGSQGINASCNFVVLDNCAIQN